MNNENLDDDNDYDEDDESDTYQIQEDGNDTDQDDLRGLVGLQNLGNTCYMNGALQALSNCQQLTRYVLDYPKYMKKGGLSESYSELMQEIWNGRKDQQYIVPASIIRNIKCIYPAFRGCTQQDTQEFLRCFLEQLHDELKQPIIDSSEHHEDTSSRSSTPDILAGDKASSNKNSDTAHRSIVSDTFEFKIASSVVCSDCNNISTIEETFKDLSIPIPTSDHPFYIELSDSRDLIDTTNPCERIPKNQNDSEKKTELLDNDEKQESSTTLKESVPSKNNENSVNLNDTARLEIAKHDSWSSLVNRWFRYWIEYISSLIWGRDVMLDDCLSIFFGSDPLEGDNEYSCDVCTKKNKGLKYLQILELPEILCIHFKRYESTNSAKITTHVSFPITGLDLSRFMSPNSQPQCTTYNLIACICHHGSTLLNGHYTTYALNCYDQQWYEFDDQYVSMVQSYQVENSEAYMLFYQKATTDEMSSRRVN